MTPERLTFGTPVAGVSCLTGTVPCVYVTQTISAVDAAVAGAVDAVQPTWAFCNECVYQN